MNLYKVKLSETYNPRDPLVGWNIAAPDAMAAAKKALKHAARTLASVEVEVHSVTYEGNVI